MRVIIHKDKNGHTISDISKVKLPWELENDIFKILNPSLKIDHEENSLASKNMLKNQ